MYAPLQNITDLTLGELQAALVCLGEPAYRARQLHQWIFSRHASGFDSMTTLPASLREKLSGAFFFSKPEVAVSNETKEDACEFPTVKILLKLPDGEAVESVLIASSERMTACVSSQAGCPLQCTFCATGKMGLHRNLSGGEITLQVQALNEIAAAKKTGAAITNVVFMGMGEPLLNTENVIEAVENLSRRNYSLNLSQRKITISTVGIVPEIAMLAESGLKTKLAVSLHAARQDKRLALMPVAAARYSLEELRASLSSYTSKTGLPVTIVYMLLEGINDTAEDARLLARFAKSFLCKINLIDYNANINIKFSPVNRTAREMFAGLLMDSGLHVTVRKSYGTAINAACGQLATSGMPNRIKL
ncbi:MAG: 23S rRNA (adenine(2503)-C(2))-methyltransferase RlmN [Chlorobiaceae bacterium]|nr:23S rRNA (adenine(2503)-C(2))-methyltransferase RlmN [Chlorobiaceae bacterium]